MKKIVFLCHGNICRSPMAEFVMKKLVADAGRGNEFEISSMAVSDEEWGNPIYPPAKSKMREHGIPFDDHRAYKITPEVFRGADLVIIMDESNRRLLRRIVPDEDFSKVRKLMEFAGSDRDVADPWYTGDFEATYRDVLSGCSALLETV
ncbi:MAG: low molecular weight phosphotyrosine protein phosphatase [Bacteroidales bacterium]|nr:low molecular weight phosphotyrosine protein phosphatase [Bacteroidales bacterium]